MSLTRSVGSARSAHQRGQRREGGQASVELALALPLVFTVALLIVQVGLVVRDQVRVVQAAREGARAAAVDSRAGAARGAALDSAGLAADRTRVAVSGRGGPGSRVVVEVTYRAPTDVPLVGPLVPEVTLAAAATMRVEG